MFIILYKILPLGVLTWSHNALKATGWKFAIQKHRPLLVEYVYRNPAVTYEWYDEFVTMLDKVSESKNNVLLLGDFNIDLLKPHLAWESTFSILGLNQLITQPA